MRYSEADLQFLAHAVAGDRRGAATLLHEWRDHPDRVESHLDDDRVLRRMVAEDRNVVEVSPRFLFTVLLRRIRRDLASIPYTVERIEPEGRLIVFDAAVVHDFLRSDEVFQYLVELLVSFERIDTLIVRGAQPRSRARRLNTLNMDDMVELAALVDAPLRPMVFRRVGDIALFTTGLFHEGVRRGARPAASAFARTFMGRGRQLEDYEAEGRRFYRLAADLLREVQPDLARVLDRLAGDFTIARKPLAVLAERYVAWARPHWVQHPS